MSVEHDENDGFGAVPGVDSEDGWNEPDPSGGGEVDPKLKPDDEYRFDDGIAYDGDDFDPPIDSSLGQQFDDIPSSEDIDREAAEAQREIAESREGPKRETQTRAEKRIQQLARARKEAAELAQRERLRALDLEKKLAEYQKTTHTSALDEVTAQEERLTAQFKQAEEDNDPIAAAKLGVELARVAARKERLSATQVPEAPSPENQPTAYEDLWLAMNRDWDRDPVEADIVRRAWADTATKYRPNTLEFFDALEERRAELRAPQPPTQQTRQQRRRPAGPPVAGVSRSPAAPSRGGQLPKEAIASARRMGLDPNDPTVRKQLMGLWSKK